jgi:hypothetical protein
LAAEVNQWEQEAPRCCSTMPPPCWTPMSTLGAGELIQWQIVPASLGQGHARLAAAAAVGLSASMGPLNAQEWREAAAVRP